METGQPSRQWLFEAGSWARADRAVSCQQRTSRPWRRPSAAFLSEAGEAWAAARARLDCRLRGAPDPADPFLVAPGAPCVYSRRAAPERGLVGPARVREPFRLTAVGTEASAR